MKCIRPIFLCLNVLQKSLDWIFAVLISWQLICVHRLAENGGAILEVNAAPGFRMHIEPSEGLPRNVAEPVVDMLFPKGSVGRIPIIAITGTNGKTTTTRLTAHIAKSAGKKVGYTTQ